MRYEIKFKLDKTRIVLDYRRKIMSYIKSILETYDKDVKDKFYNSNKTKEFTFSVYLPIESFSKEEIQLKNDQMKVYLSIHGMEDSLHFTNAILFSTNKKYPLGNLNKMQMMSVRPIREKEIRKNEAIFKTMAPIAIREHEKQWFHDFDEKGIEILKKNTIANLENKFPVKYLEELKFVPYEIRRTVVKNYGIQFPVSTGVFKVEGRREILDYLYKTGVGSKSSAGFGMVEVLD
jgi:CRISPR-associated endoribonuclease Cas6